MYIGKLAAATGVTQKTIRHYEKMGLLPEPVRQGKYRFYNQLDIQLIKMIKRAQSVGFSLAEISELAQIKAREQRFPLHIALQLFAEKREKILQKQAELDLITADLIHLEQELIQMYNIENHTE